MQTKAGAAVPEDFKRLLPEDILRHIFSFIPKTPKPAPPGPSLQRALEKLQRSPKRTAMDLYGFDDFILN